jgi:hypothetical protein
MFGRGRIEEIRKILFHEVPLSNMSIPRVDGAAFAPKQWPFQKGTSAFHIFSAD